jgi:hypothetical protein
MQTSLERDSFISQVAETLCRRGLRLPALIALDVGQPLAFVGGQLLWMAQPALSPFLSTHTVHRMARLLEEPAAVEALIACLEAKEVA